MHNRSFADKWLERFAWVGGIFAGTLALITIVATVLPQVGIPLPVSLPEVLGTTRPGDLGSCSPGMEVREGGYCQFVVAGGGGGTFRVAEGGAYPPGQSARQSSSAKVDWDNFGYTFQAVRLPDDSDTWRVLSAGPWRDIGGSDVNRNCQVGDVLQLGQFCVERRTGAQFRVYGADQHYRDDNRPLFESGYATLYWFEGGEIPSPDNSLLEPERVELGCEEQHVLAFVAQRIPALTDGAERHRGDPVQWEVLEVLDENEICKPALVQPAETTQATDASSANEQGGAIEPELEQTQGDSSNAKVSGAKTDVPTAAAETSELKTGSDQRPTSNSKISTKVTSDTVIQGSGSGSDSATFAQGEYVCQIDTSSSAAGDTHHVRIELRGESGLEIREEILDSGKKGSERRQWRVSVDEGPRVLTVTADTDATDVAWTVRCTRSTS